MDREGILWVCEQIEAQNVMPHGRNVQISCPLAPWSPGHRSNVDGKPSMGILVDPHKESVAHCFACKFGGTLEELVLELHRVSGKDLTQLIIRISEMETFDPEWLAGTIEDYDSPKKVYETKVVPEAVFDPMRNQTHPYLFRRGIELETVKAWEGGYDAEKRRVVFPVRTREGLLVGAVGRAILKVQLPKYLNYWDFDKSRFLFGEQLVREKATLVMVEGPLDAIALWQAVARAGALDQYSVVAFMGSDITAHQLKRVLADADTGISFMDNDPAGWTGQLSIARFLGRRMVTKGVRYPRNSPSDPCELVRKGFDVMAMLESAELLAA